MKKVVTLGEIMLRLSTHTGERLSQTNKLTMHYGGAEANVSVALSRFGYDVYFISKVPNNPLGEAVERHLKISRCLYRLSVKGRRTAGDLLPRVRCR
ncbi:hypothetical protein GCM10020331_076020 [Ectobacillus funiculus]